MPFLSDIRMVYHLVLSPVRGHSHAERLQSFYDGQASDYDRFRENLLRGRRELFERIEWPENGVWIDMGGGTGASLDWAADRIDSLSSSYIVDICPALLNIARRRVEELGNNRVRVVEADVTRWSPPEGYADLITFSYSLTMIQDWFAAVDHAAELLRPGGIIAVVDFFVARKHPVRPAASHSWWTRTFWPAWFALDNVHLSADHLPYLRDRFETEFVQELRFPVPFFPAARFPYYLFIGRKRGQSRSQVEANRPA